MPITVDAVHELVARIKGRTQHAVKVTASGDGPNPLLVIDVNGCLITTAGLDSERNAAAALFGTLTYGRANHALDEFEKALADELKILETGALAFDDQTWDIVGWGMRAAECREEYLDRQHLEAIWENVRRSRDQAAAS